jgi:hypothetical protein
VTPGHAFGAIFKRVALQLGGVRKHRHGCLVYLKVPPELYQLDHVVLLAEVSQACRISVLGPVRKYSRRPSKLTPIQGRTFWVKVPPRDTQPDQLPLGAV